MTMGSKLEVGLHHSRTLIVDDSLTVPKLPSAIGDLSDMPPVLATAYLVAFFEALCIEALKPFLSEGQKTVGVHVNIAHNAPTPIGMAVTATVTLTEIKGRYLRFQVECYDDGEPISTGTHERIIVDAERFESRLHAKEQGE